MKQSMCGESDVKHGHTGTLENSKIQGVREEALKRKSKQKNQEIVKEAREPECSKGCQEKKSFKDREWSPALEFSSTIPGFFTGQSKPASFFSYH